MESKRHRPEVNRPHETSFNRTSMESKHRFRHQKRRNPFLLIEPVWNRNLLAEKPDPNELQSFNRTSMESKPISSSNIFSMFFSLLIEPVWNRNTDKIHL